MEGSFKECQVRKERYFSFVIRLEKECLYLIMWFPHNCFAVMSTREPTVECRVGKFVKRNDAVKRRIKVAGVVNLGDRKDACLICVMRIKWLWRRMECAF